MRRTLPKLLSKYKDKDLLLQYRSKFIFYLNIFIIAAIAFLILFRLIIYPLSDPQYNIVFPFLVYLIILIVLMCACFWLLIRGHYRLVSYLLPGLVMLFVWIIMFTDTTEQISRMDTVVYILMLFSMCPLLLENYKYSIYFYTGANMVMVILFVLHVRDELGLTNAVIYDYIFDVSLSIIFATYVGYHIYTINKKALENAEKDYNEKLKIEKDFALSQKRYRELADSLPIAIFEVDMQGRVLYINKAAILSFGYTMDDFNAGIEADMLFDEKDDLKTRILQASLPIETRHQLLVTRKNGERFPADIFVSSIEEDGKLVGLRGAIIDISERLKAEQDLRESERKFREMTFLLPQSVYEADMNFMLTFINEAGTAMFGFTNEEINKGFSVLSVIAEEDRPRVIENIKGILHGNATKGNQYMGLHKNGSLFPIQIYSSPITVNNTTIGFRGVVIDMSEIKRVENELRKSNELFKTLIDSLPIPVTLSDLNGKLLMVNDAFCNDLGFTRDEIVGKCIWDMGVITEGGKEDVILKTLETKGFVENFEISTISKKGRHILYVYATYVTINNQKVILRSNINVTEKKVLENKLRESENLWRTMVNMVPYPVTITDINYRLTLANDAFLNRFHCSQEDIKGKTSMDIGLVFDEDSMLNYRKEFDEKGCVLNMEMKLSYGTQKQIWTLLSSNLVNIDNEPHIIHTTVDITERKQLEEYLRNYNQQLEMLVKLRTDELLQSNEELTATNEELFEKNDIIIQKNTELNEALETIKNTQLQLIETEKMASLGVLTAGVAHEVNNPLNYLMGVFVGLENYFNEHRSKEPEKIQILLSSMQVGIERISNIVKGLNQFSRNVDNMDEDCDIHAIIDNCLLMLQNKIKHKAVLKKAYYTAPIVFKGNVGRLHQVFVNLISNAIQAIPDKGNIGIKTYLKGANAIIEIEDDGVGIDKKVLPKITDPFYTTKSPGQGTGLGLSVVQSIMNEHRGQMKFESELNKGTKAKLIFPLKK